MILKRIWATESKGVCLFSITDYFWWEILSGPKEDGSRNWDYGKRGE